MLVEQFQELLDKQDEKKFLDFLRSLTPEQKKQLVPLIKKLTKEYNQWGNTGGNVYGNTNGTPEQRELLLYAGFVCHNLADFERTFYPEWMLSKGRLNKIVDWYCPAWLSDLYNKQAAKKQDMPRFMDYHWIIELSEKGHIQPTKELMAWLIPPSIYEEDKKYNWTVVPENVLKNPVTLKEHIWYLFEYESNLHYCDRFKRFGDNAPKDTSWIPVFIQYTNEKRLDRSRVLKESLLAGNRNFHKVLTGWFIQLFTELKATDTELLTLQKELFSVLSAPHSKPVNVALQSIKKIIDDKTFDTAAFLDHAPVLLASDTKAVVTLTLSLLEKILQKNTALREATVKQLCAVFIQHDKELQEKAAHLIVQYGDSKNPALRKEITALQANMLASAKQVLADFTDAAGKPETETGTTQHAVNNEVTFSTVTFPVTKDDLVFLASQALDNNEPWHIDVLAAALVQFSTSLTAEDAMRFEPAFQRALNIVSKGLRANNGALDQLLAVFIIDVGGWMVKVFPEAAERIKKVYSRYDQIQGNERASWLNPGDSPSYTDSLGSYYQNPSYEPYKQLMLAALEKIRQADTLPLLSTPTHVHGGIDPVILADRLRTYQQSGSTPASIDLQIAISRCMLQNEALDYLRQQLTGELCELLTFLLDEKASPQKPFTYKAAWVTASLTRKEKKEWAGFKSFGYYGIPIKNYTGELHWHITVKNRDSVEYKFLSEDFVIERETAVSTGATFTGMNFNDKNKEPMLYEWLVDDGTGNDMKRLLSLVPNNRERLLAEVIAANLKYSNFFEENDRKTVIAVMQAIYETWHNPGDISYLLMGTTMLSGDKTVGNIAGETWLKGVTMGQMDNVQLGKIVGLLERVEFAPLKRFTDLVAQSLLRVSSLHNQQLQLLIENILIELPDAPVTNLKKLLELYLEVIAINKTTITDPAVNEKLAVWKQNAALKKILAAVK